MLLDAGRAKIVARAADGNNQGIVGHRPLGRDHAPFVVIRRRQVHEPLRAIEPGHLPETIAEAMPVRLRQIVEFMAPRVHAAGRDLVQQRLPQVRARPLDQRDVSLAPSAELVAEPCHQLQPAGAAAHDDDLRQRAGSRQRCARA
jgi:hypothetical protein